MTVADDVLGNSEGFAQLLESLHEEARGWGRSTRDRSLKARYWNTPQSAYLKLNVRWDYRALANRLNWEAPDDYLSSSVLHECESQRLFSLLSANQNLRFERIFKTAQEHIFLRVVGHWEAGTPLTPPVLKLLDGGKLGKIDGFHRLAVALAAKVPRIPFWAVPPVALPGVSQIFPACCSVGEIDYEEITTQR